MAVGPMENGIYGEHLSISGYGNYHIQYSSVLVGAANGTRGADEASMFQLIKSSRVTSYPNSNLHDGRQRTAIHLIEHILICSLAL